MPVSDAELLRAIESGMFSLPMVPGLIDRLDVPGVVGRITSAPSPLANLVGGATLTEANADSTIRALRDFYGARGLPFGGLVGPSSTPQDLTARLAAAGITKQSEMAGMALRDLSVNVPQEPDVTVREANEGDDDVLCDIFTAGFGLPEEVSRIFLAAMRSGAGPHRQRLYLASLDGMTTLVAAAASVYLAGTPILMLGGAATLPEYRGRGLYRALLARRLADARDDGMEAAVIQAVRTTSAPICRRIGMVEMCGVDMYVWAPEAGDVAE
jgi:GNAT superfamily N-acetyltransferase